MNASEEIKSKLNQLVEDGKIIPGLINGETATPQFTEAYQNWYTPALKFVSLLGIDRLDEFRGYYLVNPNRNEMTPSTYVIQDYVSGVRPKNLAHTRHLQINFDPQTIITSKFGSQFSLLKSLSSLIDSVISDVTGYLFTELQDEELKVASQLVDVNLRAAGAVAGVVLEGHLQRVAVNHGVNILKKNPTIVDLNDPLKANNVYDVTIWRKIQLLADIRNYCDHKKDREPAVEEVKELISGTNSIIKTIF